MIIYKITNDVNDKVYIGQTTQLLTRRIQQYKEDIKWRPQCRPIISAMAKYGIDKFHFEIIAETDSKVELDKLERKYIKEYKSLVTENGYNVELGGNGPGKHSEETKRKIGEAQRGEKNHMYGKTGSLNHSSKKVIELTTGKTYGSACLAAKDLNLNFSHVCAVARGTRGSTGGYVFRYVDKNDNIIMPTQEDRAYIKFKKVLNSILPEYKQYI